MKTDEIYMLWKEIEFIIFKWFLIISVIFGSCFILYIIIDFFLLSKLKNYIKKRHRTIDANDLELIQIEKEGK